MLFIGGSQDGKRIEIEAHLDRVRFPVLPPLAYIGGSLRELPPTVSLEYDEYDRMEFSVEGKSYYLYRLTTLAPQETFETLLAGYRPYK